MGEALLEVKNLTVDFRSEDDTVRAVDGISLIEVNCIVAFRIGRLYVHFLFP